MGGVATGATSTEAFSAAGGPLGALVCHGFTGSPVSVRPWAEHLAAAGLSVESPRLPGHGTSWRDLELTTWEDWYWEVERAFHRLRARCDTVVAMGLSMGGTLVTHLAAQHPSAGAPGSGGPGPDRSAPGVDGLVLVNPSFRGDRRALRAVPVARHVVPSVRSIGNDIALEGADEVAYERVPLVAVATLRDLWEVVEGELDQVRQPVLAFRSAHDRVVGPGSLELFRRHAASEEITVVPLHRSRHVATLDHDAELIHERSLGFARRVAERRSAPPPTDSDPPSTDPPPTDPPHGDDEPATSERRP